MGCDKSAGNQTQISRANRADIVVFENKQAINDTFLVTQHCKSMNVKDTGLPEEGVLM